jgi:hypothetical protein
VIISVLLVSPLYFNFFSDSFRILTFLTTISSNEDEFTIIDIYLKVTSRHRLHKIKHMNRLPSSRFWR